MPTESLVPSMFAPVLYQARMNPHAIAVVVMDRANATYTEFCAHIERVTRQLHAKGIPAGSRVGTYIRHTYLDWVTLFALSRLGLVSALAPPAQVALLAPDVILTDRPADLPGRAVIEVDKAWMEKPGDHLPPFVDRLHQGHEQARIVLSSGTTGRPKLALLTYEHIHRRNKQQIGDYALTSATRALITMNLASVAGLMLPINCWSAGGTVILPIVRPGQSPVDLLRLEPNLLFTSTAQLDGLVASLPADFVPRATLRVYVAGSALPRKLNVYTRMRLSQSLFLCYGSTEIGTVALAPAAHADAKPGLTGYVVPPVRVEIVDEQGQPVPNGTQGEVRIRAEGQCELYLDDPETTAKAFRDGWFHPGDMGVLGDMGDLTLTGRLGELINLGGTKLAPDAVEEALAGTPGVGDMAVFAVGNADGGQQACVAVVVAPGFSKEALLRRHHQAYPRLPPITVVEVEKIPRNDMGKVLRSELAGMLSGGNAAALTGRTIH